MSVIARRVKNKKEIEFTSDMIRLSNNDFSAEAIVEYKISPEKNKKYAGKIIINVNGENKKDLLYNILPEFESLNKNWKVVEIASLDMKNTVSVEIVNKSLENDVPSGFSREGNKIEFSEYKIFVKPPKKDEIKIITEKKDGWDRIEKPEKQPDFIAIPINKDRYTKLDKIRRKQLIKAINSAYPKYTDLDMFLDLEMDIQLNEYVSEKDNHKTVIFQLVKRMIAEGRVQELIEKAKEDKSENPLIQGF